MIYIQAETAQDIAEILRLQRKDVNERINADEVASRLLGQKKASPGMVITAPRRSGKTTELLRFAEEKFSGSQYCVVSMNYEVQRQIIRKHWELFNAANVAKKLKGQATEGNEVNPPLMLTPDVLHLNRGRNSPMFCDEWNLFSEETQNAILETGLFVAAVTS